MFVLLISCYSYCVQFRRRPHNKEGGAEELASESSDSETLCGYTQTFTYIERHHIATYNHDRIMRRWGLVDIIYIMDTWVFPAQEIRLKLLALFVSKFDYTG